MAEKRVAGARPKIWRVALKLSGPLPEDSQRLLPSQIRSPLRAYLSSPDNKGAKGWEEMSTEARQPFVQMFHAARKSRTAAKSLLLQKAAVSAFLLELDQRIATALAPEAKKAAEIATSAEPAEKCESTEKLEGAQSSERPERRRRRGRRGLQALLRFKKTLVAKLPEAERSSLTQTEVVKAWKALSSLEKRAYYSSLNPTPSSS